MSYLFHESQMSICFSLCRFYELKKARSPLQLYDRFDHTDPETNICIERVSHLFINITVDIQLYSETLVGQLTKSPVPSRN